VQRRGAGSGGPYAGVSCSVNSYASVRETRLAVKVTVTAVPALLGPTDARLSNDISIGSSVVAGHTIVANSETAVPASVRATHSPVPSVAVTHASSRAVNTPVG